jgi:hypothetical protein
MGDVVTKEEFRAERIKLETDRMVLNERLQALNAERETTITNLSMVAGALQTINVFLDRIDPEVDPEDEINMSSSDQNEV